MLYKFLINLSILTFMSMYIIHYIFDKITVFNKAFAISQ